MSLPFCLGAYWWNRKESAEECLERSVGFFQDLGSCDESLAHWFQLGRSRKDALRKSVDVENRDDLLRLWKRGVHRGDVRGSVIEDLGFGIELWNGAEDDQSIGLGISCGGYTPCSIFHATWDHWRLPTRCNPCLRPWRTPGNPNGPRCDRMKRPRAGHSKRESLLSTGCCT